MLKILGPLIDNNLEKTYDFHRLVCNDKFQEELLPKKVDKLEYKDNTLIVYINEK